MNAPVPPAENRPLDLICLGRVAVDLYAQQVGARLEDTHSFAKYLGGSSGNIAFGTARLGLKSSMVTRVGDDHMGRFLTAALQAEGCDTSRIVADPDRLTALAVLGIKDRDTFPLVFYRENCADMAVSREDLDEAHIASARALLITGTHLSTPHVLETSKAALELARRHDVRTVLDIDYRPVLWGLTGQADGETRFIASDRVSAHLMSILPLFDLIVGTEEEIRIAGGGDSVLESLRAIRGVTQATLVLKRGEHGCNLFESDIPNELPPAYPSFRVTVFNVLGAGDAFMSGLLKGWLHGESWEQSCRLANACGALVVSRHGCAPAMPTPAELAYFFELDAAGGATRLDQDERLQRLHRVTTDRSHRRDLHVFAFDHRSQILELARQAGADPERIPALKALFVRAVRETQQKKADEGRQINVGILADQRFGQNALNAATGRGWWIGRPVELPGSLPVRFEYGASVAAQLHTWPLEHIVKCLVQYDVDHPEHIRADQEERMAGLYESVQVSGHDLLLEIIPPGVSAAEHDDKVIRGIERLYKLGVMPEWWKIGALSPDGWRRLDALIDEYDPHCKGVVLLGLGAPLPELVQGFQHVPASRYCRGFTVGRSIFNEPALDWLAGRIDDGELVARIRNNFEYLIDGWQAMRRGK